MFSKDGEKLAPVREMPVKSVISNPSTGATVASGSQIVSGFAWSGYAGIERVEISVDGGETWVDATITDRAGPFSWVKFEYAWQATPGTAVLESRATDQRGLTQPRTAAWNEKGYQMNAIYPVTVTVA